MSLDTAEYQKRLDKEEGCDDKTGKELERVKEMLERKESENKKLQTKLERVCNDTEYKKKILELEKKLHAINSDKGEMERERKLRKSIQAKLKDYEVKMHRLQQKVDEQGEQLKKEAENVVQQPMQESTVTQLKSANEFTLNDGELESYCEHHCNVTTLSHSASGKSKLTDNKDQSGSDIKDVSNPLKLDLSCILNERNDNSVL